MTGLEILRKNIEMYGKEFIFYCGDDTKNKLYKYNLKLCKIVGGFHNCGIETLYDVQFTDGYVVTVSNHYLYKFKVKEK